MALISRKKRPYPVGEGLRGYLGRHGRLTELPVQYADLARFDEATPVYDKRGRDTLWQSVLYPSSQRRELSADLVRTYAAMRALSDDSVMQHLVTDRVDVCPYGNTRPFRVRILNTLNDNFDYFYVKKADASRIYGLELEDLLSPSRIQFIVCEDTLVEEHIPGIPGDQFIRDHLGDSRLEGVRLAKEFVKFNERCFARLLGDMHASNFVVTLIPDFDETIVRIRAVDFDQQSYEGRCNVYMPKYYTQNNAIIDLARRCMTPETVRQYQEEEHALLRLRARAEHEALADLLATMSADELAPPEHVARLRQELARHHRDERFLGCESMGELVRASLSRLAWE